MPLIFGGIMKIFETHAHLDSKDYNKDRDTVIKECFNKGIEYIINIGCNQKTSEDSIKLAEKYDKIFATVGWHPHDAEQFDEQIFNKLVKHKKVVAVGEIGLDYYRMLSPKKVQQKVFTEQLILANNLKKPVVIHDRDAHEDTLNLMLRNKPEKAVYHCFAGDAFFAEKVLAEDFFISFTGVVTFKNSNLTDVIRITPLDKFFIETDSPYLTPIPFRGKRNTPAYLRYVIEKIAEIKQLPPKVIAEKSFENASKFFF